MTQTGFVVVGVVVIIFFAVLYALAVLWRAKRRQQALAAWATKQGWHFQTTDQDIADRLRGRVFDQGSNQTAVNVAQGPIGDRQFWVLEFQYTTWKKSREDGEPRAKINPLSVVACSIKRFVPEITVEPKRGINRLVSQLRGKAVFTGNAAFDSSYQIVASDPELTHQVLDEAVRKFSLQDKNTGWSLSGPYLLTWQVGPQKPEVAEKQILYLEQLLEVFPNSLGL